MDICSVALEMLNFGVQQIINKYIKKIIVISVATVNMLQENK